MPERFKLKTVVTSQPECQQQLCPGWDLVGYRAYGDAGYTPDMKFDYTNICAIAELEKSLGRVPTNEEVLNKLELKSDRLNDISKDCPNRYRGFRDLPIADRK
ncbi:MAG: hypothetical protein NT162_01185 [Candidatus Woesebacteria bacterium]|nr:hypothetical protein [Candidatus Woesebacteria bacterium]